MNWWECDETHDPALTSWVESARGHRDFPIQNLPLGIFAPREENARIGVAIGDIILDLRACAEAGLLGGEWEEVCADPVLNLMLMLAPEQRRALRRRVSALLSDPASRAAVESRLYTSGEVTKQLPPRNWH